MKMRSRILNRIVLCAIMCLPTVLLFAQGDPGGDPDQGVPFDGGLGLLVAAGVGYAAKKGLDRRKKRRAEEEKKTL
jgi:hypothetical protein